MANALKFPDAAKAGTRCPWCKNLKQGTCTGCGQTYGHPNSSAPVAPRGNKQARPRSPGAVGGNPESAPGNAVGEVATRETLPQARSMGTVTLTLPEPPAANRYLRMHGHITYKTREAKAYCQLVAALANDVRVNGGPAFPEGDVTVVVVWHRMRKAGDLGERTKVLYDALQGSVYADDKQIAMDWRRRCDEHPEIPKGSVRIEVCAL